MIRISNPTNHRRHNLLQLLKHFGALNSFVRQTNTEEILLAEILQSQGSWKAFVIFIFLANIKQQLYIYIYINMNLSERKKEPPFLITHEVDRLDSFLHVVAEWANKENSPKKLHLLCHLIFYFVLKMMQASIDPKIKTPWYLKEFLCRVLIRNIEHQFNSERLNRHPSYNDPYHERITLHHNFTLQ